MRHIRSLAILGVALIVPAACSSADAATKQYTNGEEFRDRLHYLNGDVVQLESWQATKPFFGEGKVTLIGRDFILFKKADNTLTIPFANILMLREKGGTSTIILR
jgi:hypothetical protein